MVAIVVLETTVYFRQCLQTYAHYSLDSRKRKFKEMATAGAETEKVNNTLAERILAGHATIFR